MSVPDLRFINQHISISKVARALDLRFSDNGNIHCWHPELHQHGDRTASVGIRSSNNTVKCFGCSVGPLGPVDLVMNVLGLRGPGAAARWIAKRFDVPDLPKGKHLVQPERHRFTVGFESDIGLLVESGLWSGLSGTACKLIPVFLELVERDSKALPLSIQLSYEAMKRYSGVASPNAIRAALSELEAIHWLKVLPGLRECGVVQGTSQYQLTPRSDKLLDLANDKFVRLRNEIKAQRTLRDEARAERKRRTITK